MRGGNHLHRSAREIATVLRATFDHVFKVLPDVVGAEVSHT
jgi:hypothetical protein